MRGEGRDEETEGEARARLNAAVISPPVIIFPAT